MKRVFLGRLQTSSALPPLTTADMQLATLPLVLVDATANAVNIELRPDGYVNATKLCQAMRKEWKHYYALTKSKEFLQALGEYTHTPITRRVSGENCLVEVGKNQHQNTWVHPDVAINLAQWLSPHVAVAVSAMIRQFAADHPDQAIRQMTEAFQKTVEDSEPLLQGFVYILRTDLVPSRVKIGFSHQNLAAIRDRYRTAFPDKTTIWAVQVSNAQEAEADVHLFFDEFREAGEWFAKDMVDEYVEYLSSVHGGDILQWKDCGL